MASNPQDGLLHPPPSSNQATMSSSSASSATSDTASDSGISSLTNSPAAPHHDPLDPTNPLNFFMDWKSFTDANTSSGAESYSSQEESTTSPSSHDSPLNGWEAPVNSGSDLGLGNDFPKSKDFGFAGNPGFDFMQMAAQNPGMMPLFTDPSIFPIENWQPPPLDSFNAFDFNGLLALAASAQTTTTMPMPPALPPSEGDAALLAAPHLQAPPSTEHTQLVQSAYPTATQQELASSKTLEDDPNKAMEELAARARQIVGLTMAQPVRLTPAGVYFLAYGSDLYISHIWTNSGGASTPSSAQQSNTNFASNLLGSSPTALSSLSTSPEPPNAQAAPVSSGRTKTSHTTIERRYRTNLNARVQELRSVVPALRVLEVKSGNRVGNLSLKAGIRRVGVDADANADDSVDVIDERGYIDGVKVARKGSKANVLGKAAEYIRVLKRREMRLKKEKDGLKALMRSLVGGAELIAHWERMWREKFGGPEKDEVDGGDADDEQDDEDDDEEYADTGGKKRKRVKAESDSGESNSAHITTATQQFSPTVTNPNSHMFAPAMPAAATSAPTEKRKRGRPRKTPLPAAPANQLAANAALAQLQQQQAQLQALAARSAVPVQPQHAVGTMEVDQKPVMQQQQAPQQQQYLLAAFAFFSFFNSPMSFSGSSSSSAWSMHRPMQTHMHSGHVVGDSQHAEAASSIALAFGWRDALQLVHLAISFFLLLSIISPWVPRLARLIPRSFAPLMGISPPAKQSSVTTSGASHVHVSDAEKSDAEIRLVLLAALRRGRTLPPALAAQELREALGLGTGVLGLMSSLIRQLGSLGGVRSRLGLERRMLEQKAFTVLSELIALDGSNHFAVSFLRVY